MLRTLSGYLDKSQAKNAIIAYYMKLQVTILPVEFEAEETNSQCGISELLQDGSPIIRIM